MVLDRESRDSCSRFRHEEHIVNELGKICNILKNQFDSTDSVVKALDGFTVDVCDSLVDQVLHRYQLSGSSNGPSRKTGLHIRPTKLPYPTLTLPPSPIFQPPPFQRPPPPPPPIFLFSTTPFAATV
ncbi:hypothetical protein ABFS82_04G000100 [Erythranthe guttata]